MGNVPTMPANVSEASEASEPSAPRWVAALDVGGMSVKYGSANSAGVVASDGQIAVDHTGSASHLLDVLAQATSRAVEGAEGVVECVAVAFPAPFDYDAGVPLLRHKFASIHRVSLRSELRERLGLCIPIKFCNDAVAAGLGEAEFGRARTDERVMMITLGTGLGACLVQGGAVVSGPQADAIPELYRSPTPNGLADDVFSARGLASRLGCEVRQLKTRVADAGRCVSDQEVLADFGGELGIFLAPHIRDIQCRSLIVGGGAGGAFRWFGPSLVEAAGCRVQRASLGSSAGLLGALVSGLGPASEASD